MYISNYRRKCKAVFLVFLLSLILCIFRLLYIQIFRSNYLADIAKKQHTLFVELEPFRGVIYDCNFKPQTLNFPADSLYASPNMMKAQDKEEAIIQLSGILNLSNDYLRNRLSRKKAFIWLARKISPEQAQAIKKLKIEGLGFLRESKRSYPNAYLASQIIGFAGLDNTGLEGIELYLDKYLRGGEGWGIFLRDARQKRLDIYEKLVLPKDGMDIVLTIDQVIQYIAERELDKAFKIHHARGASIIVMDPHTGRILAMANRPTYDLNEYKTVSKDQWRNRAICDLFEPGSAFKIVTASAALEEKRITEEDKIFCENGAYRVANHILHDHAPHGWLTFREVIEESSNIGTTKVAQMLGPQIVYKYVRLFGFGSKLGIDLPGEISGMIKEPRFWSKTSIGAVPIGQEVGVTALQLASALSVIANGGQLMRPYIISEIRTKQGEVIKRASPFLIRKVISLETAARISKILTGAVEEGTGRMARIPGFTCAGKTGTAQKLEANGAYSHNKFVASFIGFAPAEDPVVTIVVSVDEPHPYYFGGVVAAPVFRNVAVDVVRYLKTKQAVDSQMNSNANKRYH
ncbi:MAG: penicillin-binding protein [Candidatus Omnitrophica bacterium CG08_land_8_20_14_0_20_41_16]|uniref:Penicillin-binding protein n=1 Tax=Candidatus Sherwoodlollariibacterium unditelluris TaxID=1974757 RepID=A0A2G9YHN7_9BACT|nr:MAG: penicillin-binding protein [Candidatus Omnitrophica bacterium CG23_combo_of_CG06-09_8_20_14_all_41_10]PIS34318.1 MAG: penicillin-binding protein [Candidatus Omnitrophica bacterium CG08_land_8_20_14_0_20_41_16]